MPPRWSEVNHKLAIRTHTIRTAVRRMKRLKAGDPPLGILDDKPGLVQALERLAARLEAVG